ncbi:MAG: hypothetical protein FJ405_11555 [Verrucomicrobia bacterium]|nr:hypothetical protein [Verrucomicrobiota bacterium]
MSHLSICLPGRVIQAQISTPASVTPGPDGDPSDQREKAAYEKGRTEAERALREQIIAQRVEMGEAAQTLLTTLREARAEVVRQAEKQLIDLAVEVASRMVSALPIDSARVAANVREALGACEGASEITLQLHPQDLELLEQLPKPDRPLDSVSREIRVISSSSIQRGGCVVASSAGVLDNQPDAKRRAVAKAVAE